MNGTPRVGSDRPATAPELSVNGAVAIIRLNRPLQHNRIDGADIATLQQHIAAVEAEPSVRVLVLTATGPSFSSGYDLSAAQSPQQDGTDAGDGEMAFARLCDRVEVMRVPTICALNGSVYGGSTDLALACDFRIGVTGMRMRMPAGQLGIQFYPGGLRRYVSRLGLNAAKRLFLTAETIGADEMLSIGFLDRIVTPDELQATVDDLAGRIAACAPQAIAGMKRALNDLARGALDDRAAEAAFAASLRSEEFANGLKVWAQRRAS